MAICYAVAVCAVVLHGVGKDQGAAAGEYSRGLGGGRLAEASRQGAIRI